MKLADYLQGLQGAATAAELEAAIQAPFKHPFRGRTWAQISKVRIAAGLRVVAEHPLAFYVPRFGERRQLAVCGETYKVGRGGNSTGVRYAWHYAGEWAKGVLRRNGFSVRAACWLWESSWADYPHRALRVVEQAMAGTMPDPELNVLIQHERTGYGRPIRYTVEQNDADRWDYRANQPCACGGTLFDWGAGHSLGFDYVNWHCNRCPDVFTEYFGPGGLAALRSQGRRPS